jgi:DNA-binding MurR/RpiR family transcriptional regulator
MASSPQPRLDPGDDPHAPQRPSVEERIQARYASLSPAERKLADLILNFPGELASYSATELAALAEVSKAAATRLFQRLGYASYEQARRAARDAQRWGSPLYLNTPDGAGEAAEGTLAAHHQCEAANLARTLDALASLDLDAIVDTLCQARRVVLFGVRNNYMLASYARWQLIQVRDDVVLLPNAGETLAEHLAGLGAHDLLCAIGFRRRVPALGQVMRAAHAARVPILYLTDPTASRTAALATWTIRCEVRGASLFDSYAAALSVLHLLSSAVVRRLGTAGRERLKRIESLHDALRDFA